LSTKRQLLAQVTGPQVFVNASYFFRFDKNEQTEVVTALGCLIGNKSRRAIRAAEVWRRLKSLTPREVDLLCYLLSGQLNKEIAAELGIRERTIKAHRGHVMEKLGVQVVNYSPWCCVWY
jgi:FixJ family two-component response regulator